MADGMVYQFKADARVPKGVTPEGILAERDRIEHDYGKATIANSVAAVMAHPDKYPNLRAFGPADESEAMRRAIAEGIRVAYRSVIIKREPVKNEKPEPRQVRILHSVRDAEGELVYKPLDVIRESPAEVAYLIEQLRKDADNFASKMRDCLAEISAAATA